MRSRSRRGTGFERRSGGRLWLRLAAAQHLSWGRATPAQQFSGMSDTDIFLMKRALELARRGAGLVSPNPMVGAVLVNDGRVVGEGYHRYDLLKHAESYAIDAAGKLARG